VAPPRYLDTVNRRGSQSGFSACDRVPRSETSFSFFLPLSTAHACRISHVPRYRYPLLEIHGTTIIPIRDPVNRKSNLEKPRQIGAPRSPAAIRVPGSTWRCRIEPLVPNQGIYRASYNPGLIQGRKATSVRTRRRMYGGWTDGWTDGRLHNSAGEWRDVGSRTAKEGRGVVLCQCT